MQDRAQNRMTEGALADNYRHGAPHQQDGIQDPPPDGPYELYRIGDVVKMMGVNQYTLKHYEEKGILHPTVDEQTGYRYYTFRDIGSLIITRNLRNMGFSVNDVSEIFQSDPSAFEGILNDMKKSNDERLREICRENAILERRRHHLERFLAHQDTWEIVEAPDALVYLPHFEGSVLDDDIAHATRRLNWSESYEHADIAFFAPIECLTSEDERHLVSCMVPYEAPETSSPLHNLERTLPAGRRLDVFANVPVYESEQELPRIIRKAISESGARPIDGALAVVHTAYNKDGVFRMAVTATVPIADEKTTPSGTRGT